MAWLRGEEGAAVHTTSPERTGNTGSTENRELIGCSTQQLQYCTPMQYCQLPILFRVSSENVLKGTKSGNLTWGFNCTVRVDNWPLARCSSSSASLASSSRRAFSACALALDRSDCCSKVRPRPLLARRTPAGPLYGLFGWLEGSTKECGAPVARVSRESHSITPLCGTPFVRQRVWPIRCSNYSTPRLIN